MRLPGAKDSTSGPSPWPDPDDRLVEPESRQEMWRGERIEVLPAEPGHADTHTRLSRVVDLHTAEGYIASTDLLSRRSEDSDFATDASIRRDGDNPETGSRYLEELSFEIFHSQSRNYATNRARDIIRSGVRRLFGLFVRPAAGGKVAGGGTSDRDKAGSDTDQDSGSGGSLPAGRFTVTVEEWSAKRDAWILRDPDYHIHDPCLLRPLSIKALIDATEADNACARSLIAKRNPVIETLEQSHYRKGKDEGYQAGKDEGYQAGKDEGYQAGKDDGCQLGARSIVTSLLVRHFGELPDWASRRVAAADIDQLQRWLVRISTAVSVKDLLGDEG